MTVWAYARNASRRNPLYPPRQEDAARTEQKAPGIGFGGQHLCVLTSLEILDARVSVTEAFRFAHKDSVEEPLISETRINEHSSPREFASLGPGINRSASSALRMRRLAEARLDMVEVAPNLSRPSQSSWITASTEYEAAQKPRCSPQPDACSFEGNPLPTQDRS